MITNVPYLARGKQSEKLRAFCERHYSASKNDLATVFLERCLALCTEGGSASLVLPQNWLFLYSYRKLREKLLKTEIWNLFARLGPKGFRTPMWDFNVQLLTLTRRYPAYQGNALFGGTNEGSGTVFGLDVSEFRTAGAKATELMEADIRGVEQARQLKNPDARVVLRDLSDQARLDDYCTSIEGLTTGDLARFVGKFWEGTLSGIWNPYIQNVHSTEHFGARTDRVFWENGNGVLSRFPSAHNFPSEIMHGKGVLGKTGLRVTQMGKFPVTTYTGEVFGKNGATVVPDNPEHLAAIWCYCCSPEYNKEVRRVDQSLKVTNATLVTVPFNLDRWVKVADERYPNGFPRPYSDDPAQWIFHGHPCGSVVWDEAGKRNSYGELRTEPLVLQVAVARLLGYRWPAEQDADMELADEQREWVRRCDALLAHADEDGIVCIPSVRGEVPAGERLLGLLAAAFGDAWHDGVLPNLLAEAGSATLDDWLRDRFFELHCKVFHHRPFIWYVWDGRRSDGFHALVNYHKLVADDGKGRRCLESLTYSYLGDWISRQKDGVQRGEGGAEDRLAAALELQRRLVAILEGEPPFDIFVRWKPIDEQPVGWDPDVNDGVRLNSRPFMADDIPGGKKGAGILRAKPNIHWRKDRGKEPYREQEKFPWFWRDGEFTAERVNDIHLTVAKKRAAQQQSETK